MRKVKIDSKIENGVIVGTFPLVKVTRSGEERKELDHGAAGTLLEMLVANIANPKDTRQTVKSQGKSDVKSHYNYEIKQGGGVIKYGEKDYIHGSSRLIYSPHVIYDVLKIENDIATVKVDIRKQLLFCVTKKDFLYIINTLKLKKSNKSRATVNIQTVWNNTRKCPPNKSLYINFNKMLSEYNLENDELYKKIKSF